MGKRELVALLSLSSWCLVMVVWLFLAVSCVCLRFVIVVFSDFDRTWSLIWIQTVRACTHIRNRAIRRFAGGSIVARDGMLARYIAVIWLCSKKRISVQSVNSVFLEAF